MLLQANTNIERIIAKIDNDFNPDFSDWIPRVGAWCIDAMGLIGCFNTEKKRNKYKVVDRIAYINFPIKGDIKVYDCNGCEIKKLGDNSCCNNENHSTGSKEWEDRTIIHKIENVRETVAVQATQINGIVPPRYNVTEIVKGDINSRNYVITGTNKIELNFDTDCITVEVNTIKTEMSGMCGCELPVIPNNAHVIEAITYYCIYKMLCRGAKHPVFNLGASQYGTNPYYLWIQEKEVARRSYINEGEDDDSSKLFRSALFIHAFDPRN